MDYNKIIELYELGVLNNAGDVNDPAVTDMGHEDGQRFARVYAEYVADGAEVILLSMETDLKRAYCIFDNQEFLSTIQLMGLPLGYEVSKEGEALSTHEEALSYYLEGFVMGLFDVYLERFSRSRKQAYKMAG